MDKTALTDILELVDTLPGSEFYWPYTNELCITTQITGIAQIYFNPSKQKYWNQQICGEF